MYTLDTNPIIYFLQKESEVTAVLNPILTGSHQVYVSAMTEIELFSFPNLSQAEAKSIDEMLIMATVLPVSSSFARQAGQLRRLYGLKLADSAIAATALLTNSILLTRNIKDFKRVPNLKLQKI